MKCILARVAFCLLVSYGFAACSSGGSSSAGTGGQGGTVAATGGNGGQKATGGKAGTATGGAGGSLSNDLGKACESDAECGTLTCLKAGGKTILGAEGPAHGYCTMPCETGDGKCQLIGGVCGDFRASTADPSEKYCVLSCTFGSVDREAKCRGRSDVACQLYDQASMSAACFPRCSQDSQCPTGRSCDPHLGGCSDTAPTGLPLGTYCGSAADAGAPTCAGSCLSVGTAGTICSTGCVLGDPDQCGYVGAAMSIATGDHGVCVFSSTAAKAGDLGYCAQLCDTTADCRDRTDPGMYCDTASLTSAGLAHGACHWSTATAPDAGGQ